MIDIRLQEAVLFLRGRVVACIAHVGKCLIMVVVAPFVEVIGKLKASNIGGRVLEVNHDELLVFVGGLQQGRLLVVWPLAKDVSVLRLFPVSVFLLESQVHKGF